MTKLDPRLHAFRADLADRSLQGRVAAEQFSDGDDFIVVSPTADVRRSPSPDALLETEALAGERIKVFDRTPEGWAWGQLAGDGYVGWIPEESLARPGPAPTHKVSVPRTLVFRGPDIKQPVLAGLPLGARVAVTGEAEDRNARYALISPAGAVVMQHLARLDHAEADFVAVAERFAGTPYLWGGKTSQGIDCSGLVQTALGACGIAAPRDTDMQEEALGEPLPVSGGLPPLRRGDLMFWRGHVGIMQDAATILHASAFQMAVVGEPLAETLARYEAKGVVLSSVRRLP